MELRRRLSVGLLLCFTAAACGDSVDLAQEGGANDEAGVLDATAPLDADKNDGGSPDATMPDAADDASPTREGGPDAADAGGNDATLDAPDGFDAADALDAALDAPVDAALDAPVDAALDAPADAAPDADACVPRTCQPGTSCGAVPDGCGATLACGGCTPPATCSGGGVANVCGTFTPDTSGVTNLLIPEPPGRCTKNADCLNANTCDLVTQTCRCGVVADCAFNGGTWACTAGHCAGANNAACPAPFSRIGGLCRCTANANCGNGICTNNICDCAGGGNDACTTTDPNTTCNAPTRSCSCLGGSAVNGNGTCACSDATQCGGGEICIGNLCGTGH